MIALTTTSPCPPSRLVVLGSRGFIGSSLLLYASTIGWESVGFSSQDMDLTKQASAETLAKSILPTDTVVIISALTPDKGRDRKTLLTNLAMVDTVASALERARCAHLIYISSDAVYDDAAHPVRESSPCNPTSFHGVMHLTRERMLIEVAKKVNIPLLILRPCAVYGSGDTHQSYGPNRFITTAREKGEILLTGGGEEMRDHLFIQDLVAVSAKCAAHKATGVLNLASGVSRSFKEVAEIVREASGKECAIVNQPRQSAITHRHFDITELHKAFPSFQMTTLEKGIRASLKEE